MIDRLTGKSKGYGFVTLDSAATAERVLAAPQHKIGERLVEVAAPRGPPRPGFGNRTAAACTSPDPSSPLSLGIASWQ